MLASPVGEGEKKPEKNMFRSLRRYSADWTKQARRGRSLRAIQDQSSKVHKTNASARVSTTEKDVRKNPKKLTEGHERNKPPKKAAGHHQPRVQHGTIRSTKHRLSGIREKPTHHRKAEKAARHGPIPSPRDPARTSLA